MLPSGGSVWIAWTSLGNKGPSIIFVSHNSNMVRTVCERAVYIQHGGLIKEGPTDEIIKLYDIDVRSQYRYFKDANTVEQQKPEQEIFITDISVNDQLNQPRAWFEYTEGVKLKLNYAAAQPVESPIIHIRLWRDDGTACFTVRSNQPDAPYTLKSLEGSGEITLKISRNQLYGGLYRFDVSILDSTDRFVLATAKSKEFQVSGPALSLTSEHLGVYVPDTSWE